MTHPKGALTLSREDLYALVWQTPMSRLAKRFGLSDVGLKKICGKYDIPTPSLGYWAKRKHGKPVNQPPLPASNTGGKIAAFVVSADPELEPAIREAQDAALLQHSRLPSIMVSPEFPTKPDCVTSITRATLRTSKVNHEGFKTCDDSAGVDVTVGPHSINRALLIINAFIIGANQRGFSTAEHKEGIRIIVHGVPFRWRLYEIKDREAHQPTKDELKRQAQHEEYRRRWPDLYSSQPTQVYRSWNYCPSGRLAMNFTDASRPSWDPNGLVGRWRDRKSKRLEAYLDDAMAALVAHSFVVKNRLAEMAEQERQRAAELKKRRREEARREIEMRQCEFMVKKADEYAVYQRLSAFADFMQRQTSREPNDAHDRFVADLNTLVANTGKGFDWEALQKEFLQLHTNDAMSDGEVREDGHRR